MVARVSLAQLRRGVRLLLSGIEEEGGLVAAAPVMEVREIFRRFWPYSRPYRRWLPLILLFAALGSALEAATIWIYKVLVDEVLVPRDFGLLLWVVLAYLGFTLAEGVVSFCEEYLSEWVGGRFIVSLRTELFRHLQGLSLSFFDRRSLGDMIARLSDDIEEIEEILLSETVSATTYLFQFVFFVGALFYLQWQLALVSLFVVPLFLLVARFFSRKIRGATREERRRIGSISAVAQESLSNAALVQAYNRQENEVSRFGRENEGSFVAEMAATRLGALFSPLVNLIELAGVVVVIAVGTWELSQGRLTIGGLLVFLIYLRQLYTPVQGLSNLLNTLYEATAGAERVIEVFDQKPSVTEQEGAFTLNLPRGHVEFDSVRFSYPGNDREAALALLRSPRRCRPARRPRPSRADPPLAARERRGVAAGDPRLRRDRAREPRLREAWGERGGNRRRCQGRRRPRVRRGAARRVRHGGRTEGKTPLRRAEAAARRSARHDPGRPGPRPRRADHGARRKVERERHGPVAAPDGGTHHHRYLAQPPDRPPRKQDPRAGRGAYHRARHAP